MANEFLFSKRAFLADTNAEGNVYFARFFEWQGMAREDFYRHAVPNHLELMQQGLKLITVHAWLKYEKEAYLFNEVLIRVQTTSLKKMSMELGFTFINKSSEQILAVGGQKLAYSDQTGKLIPVPDAIRAGAATCLVESNANVLHMQLVKHKLIKNESTIEAR